MDFIVAELNKRKQNQNNHSFVAMWFHVFISNTNRFLTGLPDPYTDP